MQNEKIKKTVISRVVNPKPPKEDLLAQWAKAMIAHKREKNCAKKEELRKKLQEVELKITG
tara:strand:- start:25 stop:207 length:183 start_codon:yes stop_codon:yes gene_type:complete